MSLLGWRAAQRAIAACDPDWIVLVARRRGPGPADTTALASLADQQGPRGRLLVLVGEDGRGPASALDLELPGTLVRCGLRCGSGARSRNALMDLARSAAAHHRALIRLDEDDALAEAGALRTLAQRVRALDGKLPGRRRRPEALLLGNWQCRGDRVLAQPNSADPRLETRRGLQERLEGMACGDPAAELPSCNLVLLPGCVARYPAVPSAEDHALLAALLSQGLVATQPDLLLARYQLAGAATRRNHGDGAYRRLRQALWAHYRAGAP